jgi:vacuolar-type H+-ATPase subunit H
MIKGLRSRIDPVLKVAEAEFDAGHVLRGKYDEIESAHLEQVQNIQRKYDQMRDGSGKYGRSKIRQQERNEIQKTLSSRASSVRDWEAEVLDAHRSAGFNGLTGFHLTKANPAQSVV